MLCLLCRLERPVVLPIEIQNQTYFLECCPHQNRVDRFANLEALSQFTSKTASLERRVRT
jgi:hypothetical protein